MPEPERPDGEDEQPKGDTPDLAPWEEEALDAVWDKIAKENAGRGNKLASR